MPNALVQIQDISKEFKSNKQTLHALKKVSLSIYPGEILGLAGESGCGKSTLAKILVGLTKPTQGSVIFDGIDIHQCSSKEMKDFRRHVQMVFQNPSTALNPRMTIEEILSEPFEIHRLASGSERKKQILELLDQVELSSQLCQRLPHELSGGQKQRVAIARALALRPRFLICDEPLSALDVSIQAQIVNLLKDLQQRHALTYLFISHDLSIMRYLTDRMAIMHLGEVVEIANTETLWQNPEHPYTKTLLKACF